MPQPSRPLTDQVLEILAKYRNLNLKDKKACDELGKMIADSGLPAYHKEVLTVALLTDRDEVATLSLYLLKEQEKSRHAEALLAIERRALEARISKHQSS